MVGEMSATDEARIEIFKLKVIEWYKKYGDTHLPWRNISDAWSLLVAAFLLRKTTVAQVAKVYEEFLRRFPTPESLLKADRDIVEELMRPLGIEHQRSRHLKELAEHIVGRFGGKVPCDKEKLKELPGVGDYIASEVLLGACGKPEPLLDRNMIRVIERVFGVKSTKKRPHTDPNMWSFAKMLVPNNLEEARVFNYGVLDFARKICTAKNPKCVKCSIRDICCYYMSATKPKP